MALFPKAGADRSQLDDFERWVTGLASTAVGSWGARRGGWIGLIALAGAGILAWRAGTGRALLPEPMETQHAAKRSPRRLAGARRAVSSRTPKDANASASDTQGSSVSHATHPSKARVSRIAGPTQRKRVAPAGAKAAPKARTKPAAARPSATAPRTRAIEPKAPQTPHA